MLPICFGEATKLSAVLLDSDKQYEALVQLGVQTTTGDAEGEAIARSDPSQLSEQGLRAAMQGFIGPQQRVPPMHSALKRDGRPLYELAQIGRAHVRTPVTNAHLVCRLLLETKKNKPPHCIYIIDIQRH